jgi:TolA-binding protein
MLILCLATAAQVEAARKNDAEAIALWKRIVESEGETPEAPQAELEWARLLRRNGDIPGAAAHLEHMILTYSFSALVPQARRELELAKSAIPPVA